MSNKSLERYTELYSEYIALAVDLHNYHRVFKRHLGYRQCLGVKKSTRKMIRILKELQKMVRAGYLEHKKANPLKRGPKGKKNGNNNSTTTKTI